MQKFIITCLIVTLFSCSSSQNNSDNKPSEIPVTTTYPVKPMQVDNGEEEGWGADIRLSVIAKSENDTASIYKAVSSYKGQELGLLVSIPKGKEGDKGFGKGIILKSIGKQSDYLLHTLHQLYKQTADTTVTFTKNITVAYVNLNEFAKTVTGQEGQYTAAKEYKLFFEGKNEDEYAELYLNVNATDNWIELKEKDEEYRPMVLHFLRQ